MNRIVLVLVGVALIIGVVLVLKKKQEVSPPSPSEVTSTAPSKEGGAELSKPSSGALVQDETSESPTKESPAKTKVGGAPTVESSTDAAEKKPDSDSASAPSGVTTLPKTIQTPDGVDGNIGSVAQPGDDGDLPPSPKPTAEPTLAGVKGPKVWLVASDLKKVPAAKGRSSFEVGNSDGAKATTWKNRSGSKFGDGVRAKGGTTATFVRDLSTSIGSVDAVAFCAPSVKECINSAPSQIKLGMDLNHPDGWLTGPDHTGKSSKGGSSFTALFLAARGGASGNPLMENQNGEAGATKGPFLGWIGPDLVGSIHGLQGIVGMNAVALPSVAPTAVQPQIYTLRFDRKKSTLKLFLVTDKGSATQVQSIEKGDAPDNDQYAAIAIGSKNPGKGAATYVLEAATYSRALSDSEICSIHKDWNQRYKLKISGSELKPCGG